MPCGVNAPDIVTCLEMTIPVAMTACHETITLLPCSITRDAWPGPSCNTLVIFPIFFQQKLWAATSGSPNLQKPSNMPENTSKSLESYWDIYTGSLPNSKDKRINPKKKTKDKKRKSKKRKQEQADNLQIENTQQRLLWQNKEDTEGVLTMKYGNIGGWCLRQDLHKSVDLFSPFSLSEKVRFKKWGSEK